MKQFFLCLCFLCMVLFTACSGIDKYTESLAGKNLSGNGTFVVSRIGLDTESKIPELKTTFISGDMASVRSGTNAVSYREERTSSIWNAESITRKRFLSITLTNKGDIPDAIRAVAEVLNSAVDKKTVQPSP